jgi:serpin B
MRYGISAALALTALLAASATWASGQPGGKDPARAAVVNGNNAFAFDLYARLRDKDGNLFFSPYSISTALAMTYGGARGDTAAEMAKTLHFDLTPDQLHPAFAALQAELQAKGKHKYQLNIANRLWGQQGYPWLPEFLKLTRTNYGAELAELDFRGATEQSRQAINGWVEEQTKNKIKELLKPGVLQRNTKLVLTNAIYFKAAWFSQFPKDTRKGDFHLATDQKVSVPLMRQHGEYSFLDGKSLQALRLPYEGHDLDMIVLLPRKVDGLPALEKELTAAQLEGWLKKMTAYRVDVTLPKFKITSQFNLEDELAKMGMPLAFNENKADFSGMATKEQLYISKVIHKAFVDVDEKGTEAAAATAVIIAAPTGAPIIRRLPTATFRADHPFLFVIRDTRTGSVLFVGRVANPAA